MIVSQNSSTSIFCDSTSTSALNNIAILVSFLEHMIMSFSILTPFNCFLEDWDLGGLILVGITDVVGKDKEKPYSLKLKVTSAR